MTLTLFTSPSYPIYRLYFLIFRDTLRTLIPASAEMQAKVLAFQLSLSTTPATPITSVFPLLIARTM